MTVLNLSNISDLVSVRSEIERVLTEYFAGREPFITGVSTGTRTDSVSLAEAQGAVATIIAIRGGSFDGITIERSGNNITREVLPQGGKAKRGTVSYA